MGVVRSNASQNKSNSTLNIDEFDPGSKRNSFFKRNSFRVNFFGNFTKFNRKNLLKKILKISFE